MIHKQIQIIVALLCAMLLTIFGCSDQTHDFPEDVPPTGVGSLSIGFHTHSVSNLPLENVHIYFFDSNGKIAHHKYYGSMNELASDRLLIKSGHYTIYAQLNTTPQTTPWEKISPSVGVHAADNLSLKDFSDWLSEIDKAHLYPNILSGILQQEVKDGFKLLMLELKSGTGVPPVPEATELTLELTYPSPLLPDFIQVRSGENLRLRAIVEVYKRGTSERVLRQEAFVKKMNDQGLHTTTVLLPEGEYDLRIWGDYAIESNKDYHYNTQDTRNIQILPKENYQANTDSRDCFLQADGVTVSGKSQTKALTLTRPVAKYRLVADDITRYRTLMSTNNYPPLEELTITVQYEGFLPSSFDASTSKPNDAQGGYSYQTTLPSITSAMTEVELGNDYVFVNGSASSVTLTVLVKDKTGKTISRVQGVAVKYKRGLLTTVRGDFLTAGVVNPGINIDTNWDGEYDVTF